MQGCKAGDLIQQELALMLQRYLECHRHLNLWPLCLCGWSFPLASCLPPPTSAKSSLGLVTCVAEKSHGKMAVQQVQGHV